MDGQCLNDLLVTGPQTGETLISILIRFRFGKHAVVSDVAKAFYAITIAEDNRDAVRVLLPKDYSQPIDAGNVETWRYQRLVMGVTCSSWILTSLLNETIQQKMDDKSYEKLKYSQLEKLKKSFYADNSIWCCDTIEEGRLLATESQVIFDGKKMHLREWCASAIKILSDMTATDVHQLLVIKILGVDWLTKLDILKLHRNQSYDIIHPTRKELVSAIASVYDPYGLFVPVTIRGRMLEREVLEDKTDWDELTEEKHKTVWNDLREDLIRLHDIEQSRNVRLSATEPLRLVGFSDASGDAFGCGIYAWQWINGKAQCNLIAARAKLRPKEDNKATIPRMELLGLHCAAQLMATVKEAINGIPVTSETLFSDSQIALHWVHSKKRLGQYEGNRVSDIKDTGVKDFCFVPTKQNPADLPTRGITAEAMGPFWFQGPEFLQKPFTEWLQPWTELQTDEAVFACAQIGTDTIPPPPPGPPYGMKSEKYLSFTKLLRVTCFARRFIHKEARQPSRVIGKDEMVQTKKMWLKYTQQAAYGEEIKEIQKGGKPKGLVKKLQLYQDKEGLLRAAGRDNQGGYGDLILLPKEGHVTRAIVMDAHTAGEHAYDKATHNELLNEYWIPGGIRMVSAHVRRGCPKCRLAKGKPFTKPKMGQLPACRLERDTPPFFHAGLDFLGPLKVYAMASKEQIKVWVLLITCGNTRAVHLEVVSSCSAKAILFTLDRFYARRGLIQGTLHLDNATGNVKAMQLQESLEKELLKAEFPAKVDLYFSSRAKQIVFIPVRVPWYGGYYKRMIQIVKSSLKPAAWHKMLDAEEFQTMICRIEAMVNSRPITEPSRNPNEPQALTPAHFLHPTGQLHLPPMDQKDLQTPGSKSGDELRALRVKVDERVQGFWDTWQKEYITGLRRRHKESQRETKGTEKEEFPEEGAVYLLTETAPRLQWKLVRVIEVYPDGQGVVRSCKVRLPSGAESTRSVSHLVPLELSGPH